MGQSKSLYKIEFILSIHFHSQLLEHDDITNANRPPSTAPTDNKVLMNFINVLPKRLTEAVFILFYVKVSTCICRLLLLPS
jgi:hypothetical protein